MGKNEFDFGHVDFEWLLRQPAGNIHWVTEVKDRPKLLSHLHNLYPPLWGLTGGGKDSEGKSQEMKKDNIQSSRL